MGTGVRARGCLGGGERWAVLGPGGLCANGQAWCGEGRAFWGDSSRAGTSLPCVLHSSLVSTNEHLLRELGQARAQHRAEVEQLHWSYKELKKTMALSLSPQGSARPGGCSSPR